MGNGDGDGGLSSVLLFFLTFSFKIKIFHYYTILFFFSLVFGCLGAKM